MAEEYDEAKKHDAEGKAAQESVDTAMAIAAGAAAGSVLSTPLFGILGIVVPGLGLAATLGLPIMGAFAGGIAAKKLFDKAKKK